jgi:hypothetical protein
MSVKVAEVVQLKKAIEKHRNRIISHFLRTIKEGTDVGEFADGYYLADSSRHIIDSRGKVMKSVEMNSSQASHFVKNYMLSKNFSGWCVVVKRKNGSNGGNQYRLYNFEEEKYYPR